MALDRLRALSIQVLLFATLHAGPTIAAPQIQSIDGSVTPGSEIVIAGSGFGDKARPGPALWDTVGNQGGYGAIQVGASVPVCYQCPWSINTYNDSGAVVFTDKFLRYPGSKYHYRTTNYHGYLQWPRALGGKTAPASQTELYATFWIRPDGSLDGTSHSSKFFRIWDDFDGNGTGGAWTQMHFQYGPRGSTDYVSWAGWRGTAGRWNRLEVWVNTDRKIFQATTNGQVRHNVTDYVKDPAFESVGMQVARLGWDAGGTSPPDVDLTFGDIYLDTTPARVEICSSATWGECTDREVQIASSWSNDEIRFNLQPRALSTSQPLYVYVVDSNGVFNPSGVALGSDSTRPNPPSSFSAD